MLKVLMALSAVQTALIGFLCYRMIDIEARLAAFSHVSPPPIAAEGADAPDFQAFAPATAAPGAAEIRQILREELALLPREGASAAAAPAAPSSDPALAAAVGMDFDRYLARGRISAQEMAAFQTKMARLPPAERTKMLRALTKAINEGRLEGQF